MKRKITAVAMIAVCLSIVIYGTNAYFTSEEKAHNVITSGNIDIDLVEMAKNGDKLVPFENVTGVMPGQEVSKIVTVKNTGGQPAYIRIKLDKAITLADGSSENVDLGLLSYDLNKEDWTAKDGYYYYNNALGAGEETQPLFTTVTFAEKMGNMYQNSTAEINVQAQATQVANNGADVFEAAGWPEE